LEKRRELIDVLVMSVIILGLLVCCGYLSNTLQQKEKELKDIKQQMIIEQERQDSLETIIDRLEELERNQNKWMDRLQIKEVSVTKYAPLDSRAVEGQCYSGNPEITASGQKVVPGKTCAAGPELPFGTKVIVPSKGKFVVNDRGDGVGKGDIDLAVWCQDEAARWGRQEKIAIIIKG